MALLGPYLAACVLLAVAGAAKAARPSDTARALAAGAPWWPRRHGPTLVRTGALAEAALGVAALVRPAPALAGLVAASYAAFCLYVLVARARGGPLASCGCFGTPDVPATLSHVAVDAAAAVAAVAVAVAAPSGLLGAVLARQYDHGWVVAALGGLTAWLAYLVLSPLARLGALRAAPATGVAS